MGSSTTKPWIPFVGPLPRARLSIAWARSTDETMGRKLGRLSFICVASSGLPAAPQNSAAEKGYACCCSAVAPSVSMTSLHGLPSDKSSRIPGISIGMPAPITT